MLKQWAKDLPSARAVTGGELSRKCRRTIEVSSESSRANAPENVQENKSEAPGSDRNKAVVRSIPGENHVGNEENGRKEDALSSLARLHLGERNLNKPVIPKLGGNKFKIPSLKPKLKPKSNSSSDLIDLTAALKKNTIKDTNLPSFSERSPGKKSSREDFDNIQASEFSKCLTDSQKSAKRRKIHNYVQNCDSIFQFNTPSPDDIIKCALRK